MRALAQERKGQPFYKEHDRIQICEGVPELGIEKGKEGVVRDLTLHNDRVLASVKVSYSTGQPRGSVLVEVKPEPKVLSYSVEGSA